MASWTVWEHERFDTDRRAERAVFVRDGFAFAAFLFGPLWLLAHGMIVILIAYLVVMGGLNAAVSALSDARASAAGSLLLALWFGFEASALRRWSLARRGWHMTAVVEARHRLSAERRYFEARLAAEPPAAEPPGAPPAAAGPQTAAAPWGPRPGDPPLGVFPEGPR